MNHSRIPHNIAMTSKANLAIVLAVSALFGVVSSVEAAPVKLLCKGAGTMEVDTDKTPSPAIISVELDEAAGWISLDGWAVGPERLPITRSGPAVTFTNTATSPSEGVVAITTGRIEPSTGRLYIETTVTSANGPGKQFTFWNVEVTTLRFTADVPCRTP